MNFGGHGGGGYGGGNGGGGGNRAPLLNRQVSCLLFIMQKFLSNWVLSNFFGFLIFKLILGYLLII